MKKPAIYVAILLVVVCAVSCKQKIQADSIYFNGKIWTGDTSNASATAIAIKGNKIVYVGNDAGLVNAEQKIDLAGKMLLPGFIDNHTHFLSGGYNLTSVHLKDVKTKQEFIETIKLYCKNLSGDDWILGGDWNNDAWGGELPNRSWIDSVTGNHPLAISRYDGHMILANSIALQKAKLNNEAKNPFGGTIVKDARGVLTGILKDEAMNPVMHEVPSPTAKNFEQYLENASQYAVEHGFTQVHDVGSYGGWPELETYQKAYKGDHLKLRIYAFVPLNDWEKLDTYVKKNGKGDDYLRWGGVKGFVDGSLGSTTAWFYEPYLDDPSTSGFPVTDTLNLKKWVIGADAANLQVVVHAIGDRANDYILNVFDSAIRINGVKDRRFRVEHAQHMRTETMDRYFQLKVIPSMHPYHVVDDGSFAPKRLDDKRLRGTYAFKSLLDRNVPVCFGSDWTVGPLNAILGIYAATGRETSDGKNPDGWYPDQKLSVEQALKCYTVNNAYSVNMESKLGQLKKGMLADFVVLDKNLLELTPDQIKAVKVLQTVVNGKTVFTRKFL
jgi:predicted amidohydrolase YtcJ